MINFLSVVVILLSVLLIIVVLVQNSKGGGISSTFGSAQQASQLLGASRSGDVLEKVTWGLMAGIALISLLSSILL
jgi:preprotein translocase subunit SecG